MRILVDGIPKDIGGIGTLIINIVDYNDKVVEKGTVVFEFLVPMESEYIGVLEKKGYKYYLIPKIFTGNYRKCIDKIFKKNKYDYVWINNTSKINLYLPNKAKKSGSKIIMHSHGVQSEETGIKRGVFKIIEQIQGRRYCRLIDIPFACSKASAEYFYPRYLKDKCTIISNGVDTERFKFNENDRNLVRKSLSLDKDEILLGTTGRFAKVKNHIFLIRLLPMLPDDYKLIILGYGEEEDEYRQNIDALGLKDRVFLLGCKNCVEKYLSSMDIFLLPSLNEGLPFSLVEAQANGLKCIVSTGVSEEAKILDTTKFISLDDNMLWKNEIVSGLKMQDRNEAARIVGEAGYSIGSSYRKYINCLQTNTKKCSQ